MGGLESFVINWPPVYSGFYLTAYKLDKQIICRNKYKNMMPKPHSLKASEKDNEIVRILKVLSFQKPILKISWKYTNSYKKF